MGARVGNRRRLSIEDLQKILGLSAPSIYRLTCNREIGFLKLGGRCWFLPEDVEAFLARRTVAPRESERRGGRG